MKLTAAIIIACLLTACGCGCDWPAEVRKETHVREAGR